MDKVSLVLVSHSREIADGLKKLLGEMQPEVAIAAAGGEEDGGIGTNAEVIARAVEEVYTEKGTVILFDLGSALLNAELALELDGKKQNVRIADAPMIEGGLAAVIEAGFGSSVEKTAEAAEKAYEMKKIDRS
ncbi:MAG: PTS-dependent dihydroxyacetone kinase phosphotransferase subunit DhaM [Alkalicoccus sp.]|nr:MAG: PTS-dependent dihydroxyacetone kinase phosphotransferase subunit DhaM [Alkalicoccus sp.]